MGGADTGSPPAHRPPITRVLVVEDHEDCLATMVELVAMQGCDVRTARDGAEAVSIAREFQPHVVLLDLGLPVMDGYAAAVRIRADPATTHALIVAITGYGMRTDMARSARSGIDLHLVKPVAFQDLVDLLHLRGAAGDGAAGGPR